MIIRREQCKKLLDVLSDKEAGSNNQELKLVGSRLKSRGLVVRNEQFQVLETEKYERFLGLIVSLSSGISSVELLAGERLSACRDLASRAQELSLISEFEIAAYVMCGFVFGMDFDVRADLPFLKIVQAENVSSFIKASQLRMQLDSHINDVVNI